MTRFAWSTDTIFGEPETITERPEVVVQRTMPCLSRAGRPSVKSAGASILGRWSTVEAKRLLSKKRFPIQSNERGRRSKDDVRALSAAQSALTGTAVHPWLVWEASYSGIRLHSDRRKWTRHVQRLPILLMKKWRIFRFLFFFSLDGHYKTVNARTASSALHAFVTLLFPLLEGLCDFVSIKISSNYDDVDRMAVWSQLVTSAFAAISLD